MYLPIRQGAFILALALCILALLSSSSPGEKMPDPQPDGGNFPRAIHPIVSSMLTSLSERTGQFYSLIETSDLTRSEGDFLYRWDKSWNNVHDAISGIQAQAAGRTTPAPSTTSSRGDHGKSATGKLTVLVDGARQPAPNNYHELRALLHRLSSGDPSAPRGARWDFDHPSNTLVIRTRGESILDMPLPAGTRYSGNVCDVILAAVGGINKSRKDASSAQSFDDGRGPLSSDQEHRAHTRFGSVCRFGPTTVDTIVPAEQLRIDGTTTVTQPLGSFLFDIIEKNHLRVGLVGSLPPLHEIPPTAPIRPSWLVYGGATRRSPAPPSNTPR